MVWKTFQIVCIQVPNTHGRCVNAPPTPKKNNPSYFKVPSLNLAATPEWSVFIAQLKKQSNKKTHDNLDSHSAAAEMVWSFTSQPIGISVVAATWIRQAQNDVWFIGSNIFLGVARNNRKGASDFFAQGLQWAYFLDMKWWNPPLLVFWIPSFPFK